MGVYSEYLDQNMSFDEVTKMRKAQLKRISEIRGRDVLVYASNWSSNIPNAPISIDPSDVLPFNDQLSNLHSKDIDIILETPGGVAEIVEDFVNLIRKNHDHVGIIVPGTAKSAGTIFAMAADELLMGSLSALGPIDAQILSNGKRFSADAFLEGLKKIRDDAAKNKKLELAYIPMLQNLSPGEIQEFENAQKFSKTLVKKWLKEYKFKNWTVHHSSGLPVTDKEKEARAEEIAAKLGDHSFWLTHARSIRIQDFRDMKLQVTDFEENPELNDAIMRYYTLLHMTFETNIYKIYETTTSQVYRSMGQLPPIENRDIQKIPNPLVADVQCSKCGVGYKVQINFGKEFPLEKGAIPFPKDNIFKCPNCGAESDVSNIRLSLEAQTGLKIM